MVPGVAVVQCFECWCLNLIGCLFAEHILLPEHLLDK